MKVQKALLLFLGFAIAIPIIVTVISVFKQHYEATHFQGKTVEEWVEAFRVIAQPVKGVKPCICTILFTHSCPFWLEGLCLTCCGFPICNLCASCPMVKVVISQSGRKQRRLARVKQGI
jgi:hypothetical protein